jgi:hypothetical protein
MLTIISDISFTSLINARCFIMCQVLRVHLIQIRCHWSFFCLVFFLFFIKWEFRLGLFLATYIICYLFFPICPLCHFIECPISWFLTICIKGQIDCHLEEFTMVIFWAQKLCPKLNAITCSLVHRIVNGCCWLLNK